MEKESTNTVFLVSTRRMIRETDKAYVFATKRSQNCEYFTIPKVLEKKSPTVSIDNATIKINEYGAFRNAYRIEIRTWFARMLNLQKIKDQMSSTDFKIEE